MSNGNEFNKYATKHLGISSLTMHRFDSIFTNSLTPYIIEERQLNVASMDVFSRLMMDRIIFLGTPIDDYIANIVQAQLLFLESADPSKDIQIYFNTPGGSVHAGLGIYDTMQYIRPRVSTVCIGQAASMGSFLLAAGEPGMRIALPNARIMIHQPSGGAQGMASDIEIQAREILRIRARMNSLYSKFTGKPVEEIEAAMDRDNFLEADEALKFGLIDKVVDRRPEADGAAS